MKKSILADSILLTVTFIWGATFVVVQNAIAVLPPLTFNAVRFFMAAVFLFGFLLVFYRSQLAQINARLLGAGILLGIWLFLGYAFQTVGLLYTTSAKAGFITGLSVVLVPMFALLILKQKPRIPAVLGVLVATVGLYFLTMGDAVAVNRGDILIFFCAVSFALQIIFTGRYAPHFPSLALACVQIFVVSVLSGISALILENWQAALSLKTFSTPTVYIALLVTAIPATALAFLAQTECQKFTTATRVALIFAMEPVFAAATAYFFNDELLTVRALTGCMLIFLGMILAEFPFNVVVARWKKQKTISS
ncbi:DMT family transporter [Aneurinibacillus uraniidurans]|uniref:DMT family transporter n=1 Tax=Aneurinibacillus uraniidurans TaxID=2966586 RepID=UPI0023494958|nr:DMT family transporter [Aneurinibacillus sp. B1]WCN38524.1 DMT family transporter [Aneurinibacillus sp. B1]